MVSHYVIGDNISDPELDIGHQTGSKNSLKCDDGITLVVIVLDLCLDPPAEFGIQDKGIECLTFTAPGE